MHPIWIRRHLSSQGYNLFDKNDKFYTDICTQYKSEDGTDVLLADRYNDYYIENQLTCQNNCEYSDYLSESQYLKCECSVVNEDIETEDPGKVTSKSIFSTFFDVLKYSNYKVLSCYNLVFKVETLYQNGGSILTIIYFLGYLATFIIFLYKKLNYLKNEISKLFTKTKKRHDIRNKRPMQNNFKTELLIFNRRNMINTNLIPNKKKKIKER